MKKLKKDTDKAAGTGRDKHPSASKPARPTKKTGPSANEPLKKPQSPPKPKGFDKP